MLFWARKRDPPRIAGLISRFVLDRRSCFGGRAPSWLLGNNILPCSVPWCEQGPGSPKSKPWVPPINDFLLLPPDLSSRDILSVCFGVLDLVLLGLGWEAPAVVWHWIVPLECTLDLLAALGSFNGTVVAGIMIKLLALPSVCAMVALRSALLRTAAIARLKQVAVRATPRNPVKLATRIKQALRIVRWLKWGLPIFGVCNKLKGNAAKYFKAREEKRSYFLFHLVATAAPAATHASMDRANQVTQT